MIQLPFLTPRPAPAPVTGTFEWAKVTDDSPLRIQFDGSDQPLPITPVNLVGRALAVDERVWVQKHGKRVLILGSSTFG